MLVIGMSCTKKKKKQFYLSTLETPVECPEWLMSEPSEINVKEA